MSDSVQDEGLVRVIGTGVIALLTFLAAVNVRGVKAGMRLYIFNTLAKLVPLLLLLGAGLFVTNVENLAIPEWPSAASIGASTILLFYAFNGPELANNTKAPLVAVATDVFGDWGGKMLIAGVIISVYSGLSGDNRG